MALAHPKRGAPASVDAPAGLSRRIPRRRVLVCIESVVCCVQYRVPRRPQSFRALFCFALACAAASPLLTATDANAAPYRPRSDQQVLERLPGRATDPRMREMVELRRQLS